MENEKRLIYADELVERLKFKKKNSEVGLHRGLQSAMTQVMKVPTVDAVEVVRCKDCKMLCRNYADIAQHCPLSGIPVDDDDFCSHGERREDNG